MEVLRFTSVATVTVPHRAKQAVTVNSYVIPKVHALTVQCFAHIIAAGIT